MVDKGDSQITNLTKSDMRSGGWLDMVNVCQIGTKDVVTKNESVVLGRKYGINVTSLL